MQRQHGEHAGHRETTARPRPVALAVLRLLGRPNRGVRGSRRSRWTADRRAISMPWPGAGNTCCRASRRGCGSPGLSSAGRSRFPDPPAGLGDIAALAQRKRHAFLADRVQDVSVHVVWCFNPRLRHAVEGRNGHGGWLRAYAAQWRQRRRNPHESIYLAADLDRAVTQHESFVTASVARVHEATPVTLLPVVEAARVLYRLVNGGIGEWVKGTRTDAGVNWRMAGADLAAERDVVHVGGEQFGVWSCVPHPSHFVPPSLASQDFWSLRMKVSSRLGELERLNLKINRSGSQFLLAPKGTYHDWRPVSRIGAPRALPTVAGPASKDQITLVAGWCQSRTPSSCCAASTLSSEAWQMNASTQP